MRWLSLGGHEVAHQAKFDFSVLSVGPHLFLLFRDVVAHGSF